MLEHETANPQPELYKKQLSHPYGCNPHPTGTGWHFGTDEIDRALNIASHPGARQCTTCRDAILNLSAMCHCCGETHSVTKDGVKAADYLGSGAHMALVLGQWFCEFCISGMCSNCGRIVTDLASPAKDKWAQQMFHLNGVLAGCYPSFGLQHYIVRKELLEKAKTVHAQQCVTCQMKLVNKRLPYHVLDPAKGATLRNLKIIGKACFGFAKVCWGMGN